MNEVRTSCIQNGMNDHNRLREYSYTTKSTELFPRGTRHLLGSNCRPWHSETPPNARPLRTALFHTFPPQNHPFWRATADAADPPLLPSALSHKRNIQQRQNKPFVEFYSRQLGLSWDRPKCDLDATATPRGKEHGSKTYLNDRGDPSRELSNGDLPPKSLSALPLMGRHQLMITYTAREKSWFHCQGWSGHYFGKTVAIKALNGKRVDDDGTICYKRHAIWCIKASISGSRFPLWHRCGNVWRVWVH